MFKRFAAAFIAVLLLSVAVQPAVAKKPLRAPLPPLPAQSVIDSVVAQTGGAVYTPVGVSNTVLNELYGFGGVYSGITLATTQAVHYITTQGDLLETLVPVDGLGSATLAPNMTTPGAKSKPGLVIGGWFQPDDSGPRWVVLTFKNNGEPEGVRFYRPNNKFIEADLIKGQFVDHGNDGVIEAVDEGAVISDKRSCITVGVQQVCWSPAKHEDIRDTTKPSKKAKKAEKKLKKMYDIDVDFDDKNAVPDLWGKSLREGCGDYLENATSFGAIDDCKANLILASVKVGNGKKAKVLDEDDPIALLVLSTDADVRTYDTAGNYVGVLPKDKYLVLPTPVTDDTPGTATALFLVGASGNNYLIASTITQGFGSGAIGDTGQAGIRDGFARYRCFGW